ncbi:MULTISPECIES: CcdB family protein [Methylococcus]|uniref:Uncharacterized protein n=1 Tax=Methylococcus capsulatus TaxID=414 RepID=A0AA35UQU4_METCP|nr:CcdB family protein [Methylococcus capsulatus]QXP86870.1 CcdB family protein [Methylococcus capsulatus]QXP91785.1 CcdB family protein [Methylococcus capsulatus]QXP93452.1 CcdB family protein [Methylococcus capsulatus]UQN11848.1 CcdB family protein [Methylococcus capsulatus]CAI8824714.1 protein of unknown function [Methylococcus capsulatus]
MSGDLPFLPDVQTEVSSGLGIPNLAGVPVRILKVPVTSLSACRPGITRAVEFLFRGF